MKQNILPSITEPSTVATEPNSNVTNKFSNLLRKYTQKRKKERESKNEDEKKHLNIDTNALIQMEEEDKKSEIDNQKFLIKILDSHYQNTLEKLKKEYSIDKSQLNTIVVPKKNQNMDLNNLIKQVT